MFVRATGRVRHNGVSYEAGDRLPDMSGEQVDRLVGHGFAEVLPEADVPAGEGGGDEQLGQYAEFERLPAATKQVLESKPSTRPRSGRASRAKQPAGKPVAGVEAETDPSVGALGGIDPSLVPDSER